MNKEDNFKEKFKEALISTLKVISDDYKINENENKNLKSKNFNFLEIDNIKNKQDYNKIRAETDSEALKRKFSNNNIYQKNSPSNSSCKLLYNISEKIRYEVLGTKMLKGISRNLKNNYSFKILNKKKDHIKSKEDVEIAEAFELYMLKNFMEIKLDSLSEKTLSYWEKDFNNSFKNHIKYLSNNLENQDSYNSKFSEILQNMEIFDSEKNEDEKKTEEENKQDENNSNKNESNESSKSEESSQDDSLKEGVDGIDDNNEFRLDEQLLDADSESDSSENIIQKSKSGISDKE